jgi:hypothetical protein
VIFNWFLNLAGGGLSKSVQMDKNRDILEREGLRQRPYGVPEGYFDRLQTRLNAIPREAGQPAVAEKGFRNRFLPAMAWAAGVAALLAVGVWVWRGSLTPADPAQLAGLATGDTVVSVVPTDPNSLGETPSYEQIAYADLIPRTDPYIYFAEETEQPADPAEEEMLDYLLQNQNILTLNDLQK